jgi:hypothetical protein
VDTDVITLHEISLEKVFFSMDRTLTSSLITYTLNSFVGVEDAQPVPSHLLINEANTVSAKMCLLHVHMSWRTQLCTEKLTLHVWIII